MGRIFILILALPWWVFFPIAGGVAWLGEHAQLSHRAAQDERAEALVAGPPAPVDIARYDPAADPHPAGEVTLRGWIDTDLTHELVHTVDVETVGRRSLYLLFGEDDPAGAEVVRGAIVLDEAERPAFEEMLSTSWVDYARHGYIFEINGFARGDAPYDKLAFQAISERGLRPAPGFVFLTPFLDGRAAALAPVEDDRRIRELFWLLAGGIVLLGVVKRVHGVVLAGTPRISGAEPDGAEARPEPGVGADQIVEPPAASARPDPVGVPAEDHCDLAYYIGLAAAVIFVASLSYDPIFALRVMVVVVPLSLVLFLGVRFFRRLARRREEQAG